jgi:hypothetical protein
MNQQQREFEDRRGLRFPFNANAEILPETSGTPIPARVTELSFRGCFLELSAALKQQQRVRVKIFHANEHFEALADVLYVRPGGAGILFGEIQPHFRNVLQTWILTGLDRQAESSHA